MSPPSPTPSRSRHANPLIVLFWHSRIITWGGGVFAPAVTVWFRALERIPIKSRWPAALVRTGLDQFAFAPFVVSGPSNTSHAVGTKLLRPEIGFFAVMTLLEGKDMNAVKLKWNEVCSFLRIETDLGSDWWLFQAFVPTLQANWSL